MMVLMMMTMMTKMTMMKEIESRSTLPRKEAGRPVAYEHPLRGEAKAQ